MTFYVTPYRRFATLRHLRDRLLDETLPETGEDGREMQLAVDVQGTDEAYEITALVPGLDAEDLDLEILNNTVTIRGEFKASEDKNARSLLSELPTGAFSRVINLPTEVDSAKSAATIKNGILSLSVPKAEAHRPKAIKVTTLN